MIKASGCILYHIKENLFNAISAEGAQEWSSVACSTSEKHIGLSFCSEVFVWGFFI